MNAAAAKPAKLRKRMPRGFRVGHNGDLACPHRDVSCCDNCAKNNPEIVEVFGQHFWESDPVENATLRKEMEKHRAEMDAPIDQPPAPKQIPLDIVEVMLHAAEPTALPAAAGVEIVVLDERVGSCAGSMVALYGEHATVVQYVARVWGLDDPQWFADHVILGARPFHQHAEGTVVVNDAGRKFLVRVVKKGERYGLNDALVHDGGRAIGNDNDPLIEVYDLTHRDKPGFGSRGQFVSRHYASTLAKHRGGLTLDAGCSLWTLDARAAERVVTIAKSSLGGAS
jgi:hypothetical protein